MITQKQTSVDSLNRFSLTFIAEI